LALPLLLVLVLKIGAGVEGYTARFSPGVPIALAEPAAGASAAHWLAGHYKCHSGSTAVAAATKPEQLLWREVWCLVAWVQGLL
jgi:hypothetical protein